MKSTKFKILPMLLIAFGVTLSNCADLSVENTNEPTRESVLGNPENTLKLLSGGYYDFSTTVVSSWGVHQHMLSDQNTSTNNFNRYWDFSDEPRLQLNNTTTYSATSIFSTFFGGFNSSVATSNIFIKSIEVEGNTIMDGSTDVTDDVLAKAYFLRGMARGYLGLIYDQGYLIDENFDSNSGTPDFVSYSDLISASLADIDKAISLATASSTFQLDVMPNSSDLWTKAEFLDIANSLAARIAAGEARTFSEAQGLDWNAILAYANKGLGGPNAQSSLTDFSPSNVGSTGEFANYLADWLNFIVSGDPSGAPEDLGAGYNPTDVKVIHTLDPSYPVEYPADKASASEATLDPASTNDPRIAYFQYTTNPGFLNPTRNASLFTNYFSLRYQADSDWWPSSYNVTMITETEVDMIRAEANVFLGNIPNAATILNNSSAGNSPTQLSWQLPGVQLGYVNQNSLAGGHTFTGTESLAEMQFALLREYSVELDILGATGLQWYFMRRHDMLQAGTALHYPVPGGELEILGLDNYTFGGVNFADQAGTSDGANSWKNLATQAGLKAVSSKKALNHVEMYQTDKKPTPKSTFHVELGNN
jgi:hypothetical protein